MDGLGEDLVPVEEDVPGMKIKPIGGSPWTPLFYTALGGLAVFAILGGKKK